MGLSRCFSIALALGMVFSALSVLSLNASAEEGGADGFGYFWTNSDNPPPKVAYSWVEISGTGTDMGLSGDDNASGWYPIGFDFYFYGGAATQFSATTNGMLNFASWNPDFINEPIPTSDEPNAFVAPYWDDLCVGSPYNSGAVYYQLMGSAPSRQLVVEWWQIAELGDPSPLTFEVILYETGEIWFQYAALSGMNGWSATVGIENWDGSDGCQYSYESAVLHDSLAIRFSLGPIGFGPDQDGYGDPGTTVSYMLRASNNQGFTDSFDITYSSVQGWGVGLYDNLMNPLADSNGNGDPDTGDLLPGEQTTIIVTVDIPVSPAGPETTTLVAASFVDPGVWEDAILITSLAPAAFEPPFTDWGLDSNGNGLYDFLVLDFYINVTAAGDYMFQGMVFDPAWGYVTSSGNVSYLTPGVYFLQLDFLGRDFYTHGVDGPYYIALELYGAGMNWTLIDTANHTTAAYAYTDFEPVGALLEPPYYDTGYDSNANGLYEYLIINVTVNVSTPGWYRVTCDLSDSFWNWITSTSSTFWFDAGVWIASLFLDGYAISGHGVDGPYFAMLNLYDEWFNYLDSDFYSTQWYDSDQFEGGGVLDACFAPPHHDYGWDTDSDGLYNYLVVDTQLNVSVAGYYYVLGDLSDQFGGWIISDANYTYLPAGSAEVQLRFEGFVIRSSMADGPYNVSLNLLDESGVWLDWDLHTTGMYFWDDFEVPPGELMPPYSDEGIDTDGNGLYDILAVNVTVEAYEEGLYTLRGTLRDMSYNWIDYQYEQEYLDVGTHVFTLEFFGPSINSNGVDGPYLVELELSYDYAPADNDIHWTAAYSWTDFEPIPAELAPPYGEYTIDSDADGLIDYLVISVPVEVYKAGEYYLYAWVWSNWTYVADAWNLSYLDVGTNVLELFIPGWLFNVSGTVGPYEVDLDLADVMENNLDYDVYWTGYYEWWMFEGIPALFSPPHSDYGVDTDGDLLYNELVLEVMVYVQDAGNYRIFADVYDPSWMYLASFINDTYLDAGLQTVEIRMPGWMLSAHGLDGDYLVDLVLESEYYLLDTDLHQTGFYSHDEFDPEPPFIESTWASTPPLIDGIIDAGEWGGAAVVDLLAADPANDVATLMMVMNNATHLFIAFDAVGDETQGDWDKAMMAFDTGNDGVLTDGAEDRFVVGQWYGQSEVSTHMVYNAVMGDWSYDCTPFDDTLPGHAGLAGARGFGPSDNSATDHRVYEIAIPLELLGASLGDSLGFAVTGRGVYDLDGIVDTWSGWPVHGLGWLPLEAFGDIVLAHLPETSAQLTGTMGLDDWYVSSVTVELTAVGGEGGVDYTMYCLDGGTWQTYTVPFDVSVDGAHVLEFYSVDMMGNHEDTKSAAFKVDANAPTTTPTLDGTGGAGGWFSSDVTVTLGAADGSGSGVSTTHYRVDGSVWLDYTAPFVITSPGSHVVEYYSTDFAGNDEVMGSVDVGIDSTAPATTMDADSTGDLVDTWWTADVVVTLAAADEASGSGVASTMYSLDGGSWQEYTAPFTISTSGTHTVEFNSSDVAGNMESVKAGVVKIDKTAPTTTHSISGTEGEDGWYVSSLSISLAATDNTGGSGVDQRRYRLDGGAWINYTAPITIATDGSHTVEYYSVDNVGNEETAKSLTVEVDATAPSTTASVSEATVTLSASDATSGVAGTQYRVDDGAWTDYAGPFEVTGSGTHTVEFRSTDGAGNIESTKTVEVEVEGGGGVLGFYGWLALLMVIVVIAILVLIAVPKIFGMRRKAKESDARAAIKDIGSPYMQMVDEGPPKSGQEPPPPK